VNAAYLIAAIVGAGLVGASLLGVFEDDVIGDHQLGTDDVVLHGSAHPDHGSGMLSNLPFLSIRFWIFTIAAFGLIGVLLNLLDAGTPGVRAVAAVLGGLATGTTVWAMFRATRRLEAGTSASAREFSGQVGTVVVAVRGTVPGKIRLFLQGQTVELLALANDAMTSFEAGHDVFILTVRNGYAHVVATDELLAPPPDSVPNSGLPSNKGDA
jgi:hypothetical protein